MKHTFFFAVLSALIITATWATASETIASEIAGQMTRLHILANSNSEEDQQLKLKVRDRLLKEVNTAQKDLEDSEILAICQDEVKNNGYPYDVSVCRGRFYFPQKTYESVTLPAGTYNAVRIIIGSGTGENWWCVMYPPLCFGAEIGSLNEEALQALQESISPESFAVICESDSVTIRPSFKLIELWNRLRSHLPD